MEAIPGNDSGVKVSVRVGKGFHLLLRISWMDRYGFKRCILHIFQKEPYQYLQTKVAILIRYMANQILLNLLLILGNSIMVDES